MELLFIPIGTTPVVPVVVLPTAELRLPQNVAFTPIQLDAIFAPDGSSGSIACWSNFSLSTNVAADIVGALPAQPVRRVIQAAGGHVTSALTSFLAAATGVPCASHPLACSDEPAWAQPSSLLAEMESVCPCANSSLPGNATREGGDVAVGVVAAVAVGFPLLIFTSCAMRWSLQRSRAEKLWRISLAEVDFPAPPVILGRGSFGLVLKVHFRGAEAAVKRFVSPTPTEAGRRRSAGVLRVTGAPRGGAAPIGPWERAPRAGAGPEPEGRESFRAGQGDRQGRGGEVLWSNVSLHREPSLHTSTSSSVHSAIPDSPMPDNVFPAAQSQRRSSPHDLWASPLDPSQRQSLVAEVKVMVAMRHPNLCPILGVCLDPGKEFLLMEFVEGGSMADMLSCRLALTLDIRMQLAAGIAEGMQYLHLARPPLIHKDLKASNVLVDARLQPKVCDFGMTSHVSKDGEIVGTLLWNAPELLRGAGATRATDVYAYGVTLSEIFNSSGPGRHVYGKANVFQIVQGVKEGTLRPNIDVEVRKEVAELMRACWAQHVGDRPSFSNIVTLLQSLRADHLFLRPLTPQKQPEPGCDGASLPSDVLTRLQAGLKVPPVRHARAAVLFAEIDAPDAEPAALAATERTLHAAVSRILSSRGAMYPSFVRAETRGACVLLCAGLTPSSATGASPPTPDPCVAMARFAQELLSVSLEQPGCDSGVDGSAAQVLDPQDTSLHPDSVDMSRELPQPGESSATAGAAPPPRVRVGCHVGSVLAAVVGGQPGLASLSASGPPFFCIFGTTVCGAVRLAASSRPGAAQLSQRFASALVGATDVEESLRTHPPWHPGEQEPGAHPTSVWLLAGQRDGDGQDQRSVRATAAGAHRAPGTGTLHDQCGDPAVQGGWAGADQQPGASRAELLCAAASGMASGMARELQLQGHLPPHPARSASTACRLDAHGAVLDLIAEATAGAASGDEIQGALTKLVAKFNFKIYEIDQSEYYGQEAKATEEGVLSDLGESRTMVIGTGNSSGGLSKSRAGASAPGTWGLSDLLLVSPKSS